MAPAGAPLPVGAVLRSLLTGPAHGSPEDVLRLALGVRHVFCISSGRAALTLVLRAMQMGSSRREVVIPAGTLDDVPVIRPGANILRSSKAGSSCRGEGPLCHAEYTNGR